MSLRRSAISMVLGAVLASGIVTASFGAYQDDIMIPELGTAGSLGISVQREEAIGEFFMRSARGFMNVADDPVLTEYVNSLGNRLLAHADNVRFDFDFFVVRDSALNASAFLGGKVAINTGLFMYADTEDEFASVLSHEIIHVTQRHIARYVEEMTQSTRLSTAGLIGAAVMSIVNPTLGMAALSSTMGASVQHGINYTRSNELEADRLGIRLLYRAGLNPEGTVDLFKKLFAQQGNINPAFALLLDHPLSEERVAEAQYRVNELGRRKNSANPDYDMARARVLVRYETSAQDQAALTDRLKLNVEKHSPVLINYALALNAFELKKYKESREYLSRIRVGKDNLFIADLLTDLDLAERDNKSALQRMSAMYKRSPKNQTVIANYANALIASAEYAQAVKVLRQYLLYRQNDVIATDMLYQAYLKSGNKCDAMQMRGESYALRANYNYSIGMYNQALQLCADTLTQERIKARIAEISVQRTRDEALMRGN